MKSFPSTLNESQNMYGSTKSHDYTSKFDIERLIHGGMNLNKSIPVVQEMFKEPNINISNYQAYPAIYKMQNPALIASDSPKSGDEQIYYENPLELPPDIIALAKDYDWIYKVQAKSLTSVGEKSGDSLKADIANTSVAPSMFNPLYGISMMGLTRNTPLINDTIDGKLDKTTSDCSIRTLCALSKKANSPMGQARYKYADFMYCKDLGKVANNHLITLRKFAHPIGDHIFRFTTPKHIAESKDYSFQVEGDVGRLITWFGTDDNKLEDICKYSYQATWKELEAKIEEQDSKADDSSSGILGMISNSLNPVYNKGVAAGTAGDHSVWGWLGSKLTPKVFQGIGKNNGLLRNYDNNKVYTPKNTIQSTHIYEGKLVFSQEFTLNFSYQLRAYDNINPRSALLDLIGNILEVTYRRGKFWGGSRKLIGPPQDMAPFNKTSAFIDNAFDKLGGFFSSLVNGGISWETILGSIGSWAKNAVGQAMNAAKEAVANPGATGQQIAGYIKELATTTGMSEAAKGYLKNALGRPTLYAWQSLLSGDDVGLWHVTIGNPRNPILSIGNLILTNATVQHSGPLGIDDFPTELKVSVTLKHARPRDVTEIGRMYTQGASALYHVFGHHDIKDFFGGPGSGGTQTNATTAIEDANGNVTVEKKELTEEQKKANESATDAAFAQDIDSAKTSYGEVPEVNIGSISNPFLDSAEAIRIVRTNNWSNTMLSMSLQEVA